MKRTPTVPAVRFGTIIAFALLLAGCSSEKKATDTPAARSTDSVMARRAMPADTIPTSSASTDTAVTVSERPAPTAGMGISRADITGRLQETTFAKGSDVDGQESYTGRSGPAMVELLGPEDNLTRASITTVMTLADGESVRSNGYAFGRFTAIVNPTANDWLLENIQKGDYTTGYDLRKAFDGRSSHIRYVPIDAGRGTLTLTFEKE